MSSDFVDGIINTAPEESDRKQSRKEDVVKIVKLIATALIIILALILITNPTFVFEVAASTSEALLTLPETGTGTGDASSKPLAVLFGLAVVTLVFAGTSLRDTRR